MLVLLCQSSYTAVQALALNKIHRCRMLYLSCKIKWFYIFRWATRLVLYAKAVKASYFSRHFYFNIYTKFTKDPDNILNEGSWSHEYCRSIHWLPGSRFNRNHCIILIVELQLTCFFILQSRSPDASSSAADSPCSKRSMSACWVFRVWSATAVRMALFLSSIYMNIVFLTGSQFNNRMLTSLSRQVRSRK